MTDRLAQVEMYRDRWIEAVTERDAAREAARSMWECIQGQLAQAYAEKYHWLDGRQAP